MKYEFDEKIKLLNIEFFMYLLFILAAVIDLFANEKTRSLLEENKTPDDQIRQEYITANILIFIVFFVFMLRNYYNLSQLAEESAEYEFAQSRFIGSVLIVIGQLFVLHYFFHTTTFSKKNN